jgi:hypothetical protein
MLIIWLAIEIKSFFDKGGSNNDLAYPLFKILVLSLGTLALGNFELFEKIVTGTLESVVTTPMKLISRSTTRC